MFLLLERRLGIVCPFCTRGRFLGQVVEKEAEELADELNSDKPEFHGEKQYQGDSDLTSY